MTERIAYQFNGDHVLKFAGMQKLTGEQVVDELNRLYTIIAEKNEEIAALEREAEPWIPVSERLPEKGVPVLVYTPPCYGQEESSTGLDLIDPSSDGDVWLIHSEIYEHYCAVSDGINCTGPDETAPYTHWMPLPAAPKEQSDE